MNFEPLRLLAACAAFACLAGTAAAAAEPAHGDTAATLRRWQQAYESTRDKVTDAKLRWAWAPDGSSLVFELTVDGRRRLFRCATANGDVQPVLGDQPEATWKSFRFAADGALHLEREQGWLRVDPTSGRTEPGTAPSTSDRSEPRRRRGPRSPRGSWRSPDGHWEVIQRDHHLLLRDLQQANAEPHPLTRDADPAHPWTGEPVWAPDSSRFAIWRTTKAPSTRTVRLVEAAPGDQLQPKFRDIPYPKPGDPIDIRAPWAFAVDGTEPLAPDPQLTGEPFESRRLDWRPDSRRFTWEVVERGFGALRVIEADASARTQRVLVNESSDTFVFVSGKSFRHDLADGREILWTSERDGWNHLYLLDGADGSVKRQLTRGEWVVREVVRVDEEQRTVLLRISGCWPGQDPYLIHYARVGIDDAKLVPLTRSDGDHGDLDFSPDGNYYVCRWSRVDHPPVHELRRAADGGLVRVLAEADATALLATGWRPPQPFMAKDREGKFDIWGVIVRPPGFDPARKYPVIEHIYAGPQDSFVPKSWEPWHRNLRELAAEGFITVMIDGRGTSNRCREFHHFCYKNLKDAGLPDRIAWLKAAAATAEPAMDLRRVGIFGGSAGGQSALGAVLFHPDFYRAAAADCGCHDNRMDKLWWNEQWMDWPVGPHYADNSNTTHAAKLQGALLLTVGALDDNVDPSSTMQVVKALVDADKEFELMVFPDHGHGCCESNYGRALRARFFRRHLGGPR